MPEAECEVADDRRLWPGGHGVGLLPGRVDNGSASRTHSAFYDQGLDRPDVQVLREPLKTDVIRHFSI